MTRRTAQRRSAKPVRASGRHSKLARRITGGLALLFALVTMGLVYSALQPHPQTAAAAPASAQDIAQGKALFQGNTCITCHGTNLQGVVGRGPSLVGVGQAAVYFQVSTGRMPLAAQGAQSPRKDPIFSEDQINDIGAYVESNGGGPAVPQVADADLIDTANLSKGADLYRLNCASCHNFTGQGGALSQGKYAPALDEATSKQIYAAMLSGPENMPQFSDGQLTPTEKKAIITYVQNTKATVDPGGYDLGGFGPAPEGLAAFLIGMGALVALTLWMGARA